MSTQRRTAALTLAAMIATSLVACTDTSPTTDEPNSPQTGDTGEPVVEDIEPPSQEDLVLWLDGDDPMGDGSAVPTGPLEVWIDKSPEEADFYYLPPDLDTKPSLVNRGGRTVVEFDGFDDAMYRENYQPITWYDYTVIVVGYGDDEKNVFLAGAATESGGYGLLLESSTDRNVRFLHRMPFGNSGGDNLVTAGGNVVHGELNSLWMARDFNFGESTMAAYVNDAAPEETDVSSNWFSENLDLSMGRLGLEASDRRALDGQIAEVLIYKGFLTPDSAPDVVAYLKAKWGVSL